MSSLIPVLLAVLNSSLNLGDVVISTEVRHHDADVTAFGYEIGQMAGQPAAFAADPTLIDIVEKALQSMKDTHAVRGLICTGDAFVCTPEKQAFIRQHFPKECDCSRNGSISHCANLPSVPQTVRSRACHF